MARIDHPISPSFIMRLGRRADGTYQATNRIIIHPDDVVAIAFDTTAIYGPNQNIASVGAITITAAAQLGLGSAAVKGTLAVMVADGNQVAGQSYRVSVPLTMANGDVIVAVGFVDCVAEPAS